MNLAEKSYSAVRESVLKDGLLWAKQERGLKEKTYHKSLEKTGQLADLEQFTKSQKRRSQLTCMSDEIADRMDECFIGGYSQTTTQLYFISPHCGVIEAQPKYRKCCMIPSVARSKRGPRLKQLEYWIQTNPFKERMLVITNGERCTSYHLKARWSAQSKRIREFNKSWTARGMGVSIVSRSAEVGSIYKKKSGQFILDDNGNKIRCVDEFGRQTFHPHTHCILHMERKLSKVEFSALIEFEQKFFNQAKPDHGVIRDARECCKYISKPQEIKALTRWEFILYHKHTKGARTFQTMGKLQDQMKFLEARTMSLVPVTDPDTGKTFLQPQKNWNQSELGFRKTDGEVLGELESSTGPKTGPDGQFTIVGRCAPMPRHTPVSEPVFIVRSESRITIEDFRNHYYVKRIMDQTRGDYESGNRLCMELYGRDALTLGSDLTIGSADLGLARINEHKKFVSPDNTPRNGRESFHNSPKKPMSRANGAFFDGIQPNAVEEPAENPEIFTTKTKKNPVAMRTEPSLMVQSQN